MRLISHRWLIRRSFTPFYADQEFHQCDAAIDCEAPEEAAPLLSVFDIALARACAAADNTHSAYMSFEFCLRCDVLVYHFLGWGMVLPIIYRCIFMRACPTADQTEGA